MTDLTQQQILFGSGTPDGLQIALTTSFQTLHEAVAGTTGKDLVTVALCNPTAGALDYTIGWGAQAAKDLIVGTLAAKSGIVLVVEARPLSGGQCVFAKGSGAGINAACYVGRLT